MDVADFDGRRREVRRFPVVLASKHESVSARLNVVECKKRVEHRQLMETVIAGDADGAFTVMLTHIETSLGVTAAWRLRKPNPTSIP